MNPTTTTTATTATTTTTTNQRCTRAITITHQQANRLQYRSCVSCHESESFVGAGKQTRARARVTNNNDNKLLRHNRRLTLLPTSLPPSSYHRHDPCRSARCAIRAAIYIYLNDDATDRIRVRVVIVSFCQQMSFV